VEKRGKVALLGDGLAYLEQGFELARECSTARRAPLRRRTECTATRAFSCPGRSGLVAVSSFSCRRRSPRRSNTPGASSKPCSNQRGPSPSTRPSRAFPRPRRAPPSVVDFDFSPSSSRSRAQCYALAHPETRHPTETKTARNASGRSSFRLGLANTKPFVVSDIEEIASRISCNACVSMASALLPSFR